MNDTPITPVKDLEPATLVTACRNAEKLSHSLPVTIRSYTIAMYAAVELNKIMGGLK